VTFPAYQTPSLKTRVGIYALRQTKLDQSELSLSWLLMVRCTHLSFWFYTD